MTSAARSRSARFRRWAGFFLVVLWLAPALALAQRDGPGDADAQAQTLFREVMSPFCPGLTLADCPSPQAFELRGDIASRLRNGDSREAILDELVSTYGTAILSDPSDTPIGRVVWGVPIGLSLLAAAALAWFLRHVTRPREDVAAVGDQPLSARLRLDEELSALD